MVPGGEFEDGEHQVNKRSPHPHRQQNAVKAQTHKKEETDELATGGKKISVILIKSL